MGQRNFEKPFEFHNFNEIFYCGMTRLRNTIFNSWTQEHELGCFYTMSTHKDHLKKQKYGTKSI